ncbi:MAG: UvrD-helicase domain-containing protein, partial [Actinomycetota bacterium]
MTDSDAAGGASETRIGPDQWAEHQVPPGRPQIVVGGPGTGKTAFLCNRIAAAIESGAVSPEETIVLTFSRSGANDIRTRLASLLGSVSSRINVSTYHSIAMRIGEAHATDLGWTSPPSVLAGAEQERFVASLLSDEDPAAWALPFRPILTSNEFAGEMTDFILRCHEHLKQPSDIAKEDRDLWKGIPGFFDRYLKVQVLRGRTDYGRVLSDAVAAIESSPSLSEQYRLVVADEYQDTSPAQARLLLGISQHTSDLIVAADPYQSIYSFRGTDLDNVFSFPDATERALGKRSERLVLTTSFRVPSEILSSAVAVTRRELRGGAGKVLSTRTGGSVMAHTFSMRSEEADWIASDIERLHLLEGVPLERIAVFMRTRTEFAAELATALDQRSLPHTHDESRLADEPIVRFVRDLVAATTGDDDALRRVLLSPYIAAPVGSVTSLEQKLRSGSGLAELISETITDGEGLAELISDDSWATESPAPVGLWTVWTTLPQLASVAIDDSRRSDRKAWAA